MALTYKYEDKILQNRLYEYWIKAADIAYHPAFIDDILSSGGANDRL